MLTCLIREQSYVQERKGARAVFGMLARLLTLARVRLFFACQLEMEIAAQCDHVTSREMLVGIDFGTYGQFIHMEI